MYKPLTYAAVRCDNGSISWSDSTQHSAPPACLTQKDIDRIQSHLGHSGIGALFASVKPYQVCTLALDSLGTSLELLCVWQLWLRHRVDNARLQIIVISQCPFSDADLGCAIDCFAPELNTLGQLLLQQYPPALPGAHRLLWLESGLIIDLWQGEVDDILTQLVCPRPFDLLIQTQSDVPTAHLITQYAHIYGTSSQRIDLSLDSIDTPCSPLNPLNLPPPVLDPSQSIAIVGAGIAGLWTAHSLAQRGYCVTLLDQSAPLAGASGNPLAMLVPRPVVMHLVAKTLQSVGAMATRRWLKSQMPFCIEQTGALWLLTGSQANDLRKITGYPSHYYTPLNQSDASQLAGMALTTEALLLPSGCVIKPHLLAQAILSHPLIHQTRLKLLELQQDPTTPLQWQLKGEDSTAIKADHVILATSMSTPMFCQGLATFRPIRGQITMTPSALPPRLPLCYGGYCTATTDPDGSVQLLLGASFVRDDTSTDVKVSDHAHNAALFNHIAVQSLSDPQPHWQGRAAIRSQVRDYYPLVGKSPTQSKVYVLTALGSKGFAYAPICAELLVSGLCGEVLPLPKTLSEACNSQRIITQVW